MAFNVYDLSSRKQWEQALEKLPIENQDIYYTPKYYSLYEKNGDGRAECVVFDDKDKIAVYPYLLNSINNLGYSLDNEYYDIQGAYGYNGIISSCQNESFINEFYSRFNKYCLENNIVTEFTRFNPILNNYQLSKKYMSVSFNRQTVFVDLTKDISHILSQFSSSTKRSIRKAEKNNLYCTVNGYKPTEEETFKKLYHSTMSRVGASPYLFFSEEYFNYLFKMGNVVQFIVEYKNTPIASSLCFLSNKYFHYHLGASSEEFLNLRPNNFLFQEMIKYGKSKNCVCLHLGGGSTSDKQDSLLRFKTGFSGTLKDYFIGKKIHNYKIYDNIINQWRTKYPILYEKHKNILLGYREIIY